MRLSIKALSFGYGEKPIFENFSLEAGGENPLVILGPSGCGKTTLLRLIAGLEKPRAGDISLAGITKDTNREGKKRKKKDEDLIPKPLSAFAVKFPDMFCGSSFAAEISMVFQESRLLPWLTALENVSLPIKKLLGKNAAEERGRRFLELAGLGDRLGSFPAELSGGQKQRVSIARAFAYPGSLILMDEPFQSLDIPLRLGLMDLTRSLLVLENRLLVAVTHDPREAVYLGQRVILLGREGRGIILDEWLDIPPEDRRYASPASALTEARLMEALSAESGRM